jgi:predicted 3-demethylubiquinone-9 3-methyltransferase (glyoxalase superfamily)
MPKITTFLTYNDQAEDAAKLYTSVFKDARITDVTRYGEGAPFPKGAAMGVSFELEGQPVYAMNGGPSFTFAEGISLHVSCETQQEIDDYSAKLIAGGGEQGPCGWLKDRFGVSWQIVPRILAELLGDKDAAKAQRAMQAMLGMKKLDIAGLRRAHDGP